MELPQKSRWFSTWLSWVNPTKSDVDDYYDDDDDYHYYYYYYYYYDEDNYLQRIFFFNRTAILLSCSVVETFCHHLTWVCIVFLLHIAVSLEFSGSGVHGCRVGSPWKIPSVFGCNCKSLKTLKGLSLKKRNWGYTTGTTRTSLNSQLLGGFLVMECMEPAGARDAFDMVLELFGSGNIFWI